MIPVPEPGQDLGGPEPAVGKDERRQDPVGGPAGLASDLADADERAVGEMADPVLVAVDAQAPGHPAIGAVLGDGDDAAAEVLEIALEGLGIEVEDDGPGAAAGPRSG